MQDKAKTDYKSRLCAQLENLKNNLEVITGGTKAKDINIQLFVI